MALPDENGLCSGSRQVSYSCYLRLVAIEGAIHHPGWLDSTICGTIQNPERTSEIRVLLVLLVEFPSVPPVFFTKKKSPRVVEENFQWSTTREFALCPRDTRAFLDRGGVCNVFCRCN